jgi:hypothetical protein
VKYFDVINEGSIRPVSVIHFKQKPLQSVVPVVFIKNDVFENIPVNEADSLVARIHRLIRSINEAHGISISEVQFDCDWTRNTKTSYFHFLQAYEQISGLPLSATIRLHQVKYRQTTGIPPVKKGVLMFYNIGRISSDTANSIYDKRLADKYTPWLKDYSLPLDIALPVFQWGIHIRGKEIIGLLNKEINKGMISDTSFTVMDHATYKIKRDGFKAGFYFKKGDEIKVEDVSAGQLLEIARTLKRSLSHVPSTLLFYDLDSVNLKQYDKQIFKQVRDCFN